MDQEGRLIFKEWSSGRSHNLDYGKDILYAWGLSFSPRYGGTRVYGESPASLKGSSTVTWLTKQQVRGQMGGTSVLTLRDPAIRDQSTAEKVAKAKFERLQQTFLLAVKTIGRPEIGLGDVVSIREIPEPAVEGECHVVAIEHDLSKTRGFTSLISCRIRR